MVGKEPKPLGLIDSIKDKLKKSRKKRRSDNLIIIPGNCQHIGARSDQQDAFGFSDLEDIEFVKNYGVLAVIADGMGGLKFGKEASNFAVKAFLDLYTSQSSIDQEIPYRLADIVHEANDRLFNMAFDVNMEMNIGTTLSAVVVKKDELYYISVGDSRIYHFCNNTVTKLTNEHVYARELEKRAASGEISVSEVRSHPARHALTSYLGIPQIKEIDQNIEPIILRPGDRIILLTDGVYNNLTQDELTNSMKLTPQEAADNIINTVAAKGLVYQDNMTAVILEYN